VSRRRGQLLAGQMNKKSVKKQEEKASQVAANFRPKGKISKGKETRKDDCGRKGYCGAHKRWGVLERSAKTSRGGSRTENVKRGR